MNMDDEIIKAKFTAAIKTLKNNGATDSQIASVVQSLCYELNGMHHEG